MSQANDELAVLIRALKLRAPADAAQLLSVLPATTVEQALAALSPEQAEPIARLLSSNLTASAQGDLSATVSQLMEPLRGVFARSSSVAEAIRWLRAAASPEEITYLYVQDHQQKLCGLVVPRDLLLVEPTALLDEVMLTTPFHLSLSDSLGEAVQATIKRHYPVYPVCDDDGRLVGQLRGWKLFEQQALELTAQSGRMVGVDQQERLDTGFWTAFKMRHPWLQINLLTAFLAAFVVGSFEETISRIVALAAFLPLLAGQSGNTGCQALAITLRGLTLGDFENVSVRRLVVKEALLGTLNGFLTGLVAGAAMWFTAGGVKGDPQALTLALVIVLAMTGACLASGIFGVMVPLILRRFGADPATASSIFLTTGTDIAGMGLMLFLATALVL